jgi:uncharacterized protein YgbK (DUF1537 family)
MSDKEEKGKSGLVKREEDHVTLPPEKTMIIGNGIPLDLTGMTEDQIQAIKQKYAERMIEIHAKAVEGGVDTDNLNKRLGTMGEHVISQIKEGASVTATTVIEDSIGRTEIIEGKSKAADEGKLSRSQAGLRDLYPFWIGVGIFIIIVIAIIVKTR